MRKALLLVQGITDKNYIFDDLIHFLNLGKPCSEHRNYRYKNYEYPSEWLLADSRHNYDLIFSINTEKYLCNIWTPFGWIDRLGDWFKGNFGKADVIRKVILEEIERIKKTYGIEEIDVLAHSYGTQILIGVDYKFNKVVFCGSPLSSKHWYVRTRARNELKGKPFMQCNEFYYLWNTKDRVCTDSIGGHMNWATTQSIECARGHTFYNPDKKLEDCYLPHADKILKIRSK